MRDAPQPPEPRVAAQPAGGGQRFRPEQGGRPQRIAIGGHHIAAAVVGDEQGLQVLLRQAGLVHERDQHGIASPFQSGGRPGQRRRHAGFPGGVEHDGRARDQRRERVRVRTEHHHDTRGARGLREPDRALQQGLATDGEQLLGPSEPGAAARGKHHGIVFATCSHVSFPEDLVRRPPR